MNSTTTSVGCGLASAASWGTGDFAGGMAVKRANVFGVIAIAHGADVLLMITVALLAGEHFPRAHEMWWGVASGVVNGFALAALYRALSSGTMSIAAPLSAVLAAALPVVYAAFSQGLPNRIQLAGFAVAAVSILLLSLPSGKVGRPKGLSLAILSGLGFGFFFIALHKATMHTYFWPTAASRFGSAAIAACMLAGTGVRIPSKPHVLWLALASGIFDLGGNLLFVVADHAGRVDVAAMLASLYPGATVLLARVLLKERVSRWQELGIVAGLLAVVMIARG